ncbi:MAG: alpha/beta hydrolase [Hyphomicrobiales bacterium]|nr:alpha/beta hydrolase [Hyphomicrobiales bacterium]
MPHVQADGARLYYEEAGAGHPIVFVHEFGADLREWEMQLRFFSRAYRCIAYNARGYPPSDVPNDLSLYGWEHACEDIAAIMRGLQISRAHVVGLSMGGYAALQFGLRHPDMASAIVAAGAGTGSAPSVREAWLKEAPNLARGFKERGMPAMAEEMGHAPTRIQLKRKDPRGWAETIERLKNHSPEGMSNTMARYQAQRPSLHDFRDAFAGMRTPVLLAVGDEDAPCLETNMMLKAAIPSAGLWVCPNTGHAINLEEPAAFNAQVQDFFSAAERGTWPTRSA